MILTKFTNRFGATLITCADHEAAQSAHFPGGFVDRVEGADGVCRLCQEAAERAAHPGRVREALLSPLLSHTRLRGGPRTCLPPLPAGWYVTVYHRDATSPTGVLAAISASQDVFDAIYRELVVAGLISSNKSPLSPTEGFGYFGGRS